MGVSVYGNALDALESADLVYDSYYNEFKLGKKRIFVDGTVLKIDNTTGKPHLFFDANDTVFYNLPAENQEGKQAITESNMELRVEEHRRGLQDQLDIISEKCGFGRGYYKFDGDQVKTATEVISQNSKLYRKIRKDEILLNDALIGLVRAVLWLSSVRSEFEVSVNFDDSIIEDTKAKRDGALLEYNSGLIDDVEYHKIVRNMDEAAAIELVNKMRSRVPAEEPPPDPDGDGTDGAEGLDEDGASHRGGAK
jgi:A118 family predicted phage portal protein